MTGEGDKAKRGRLGFTLYTGLVEKTISQNHLLSCFTAILDETLVFSESE